MPLPDDPTPPDGFPAATASENPPSISHPPDPVWPPWRIWDGLALVALFFLAQLALSAGVSAALAAWLPRGATEDLELLVLYSLPVGLVGSYAVGVLGVRWLLVRRCGVGIAEALALGPYPPLRLIGPFLGGMALQFVLTLAVRFYPPGTDDEFLFEVFLKHGPWALAFFMGVAVVAAPLMEETLFRGLLLPALLKRVPFPVAALAVTGLFTALHGFAIGGYWPALMGIFVCGWILARLRVSRGTLWAPIVFHVGFNFAAFVPVLLGRMA